MDIYSLTALVAVLAPIAICAAIGFAKADSVSSYINGFSVQLGQLGGGAATAQPSTNWTKVGTAGAKIATTIHDATEGTTDPNWRAGVRAMTWMYIIFIVVALIVLTLKFIAFHGGEFLYLGILLAPVWVSLLLVATMPTDGIAYVNSKSRSVSEYYERTKGTNGFFLRWTVRPALWLNNRIFHSTEQATFSDAKKAGIRLIAAMYLSGLIVFSMYLLISLILALVLFAIAYLIVAHFMDWPSPGLPNLTGRRPGGAYPGGTTETRNREDIFGRPYAEHRDKSGDVSGTTRQKEDWVGRPYAEHKGTDGNKTGETRTKEDIFGRSYDEHRDKDGNVTGTSREREDIFGRSYTEHRDADGNVAGESREKEDWLGRPYTEHKPKD